MDQRSKPYFFAFDGVAQGGKITAHCVRIETIEMDAENFDTSQFTLLGADFDDDKRIRDMMRSAHSFIKMNKLEESTRLTKRGKKWGVSSPMRFKPYRRQWARAYTWAEKNEKIERKDAQSGNDRWW
jgi:hypothetical protein